MTSQAPIEYGIDLVDVLVDYELDAELRAQAVVDVATRLDLDPLRLATWIFKPPVRGKFLRIPGLARASLHDDIDKRAPDFQIPPIPGESAWSYTARMAEENGYIGSSRVKRFAAMYLGWRPGSESTHAARWALLAPRFSAEVTAWLEGRLRVKWADDPSRAPRPFCVLCIKQDAVFLEAWENGADTCDAHAVPLQRQCRRCARELTWHEGSLRRCECGARLDHGEASRLAPRRAAERDRRVPAAHLCERQFLHVRSSSVELRRTIKRWNTDLCHFGSCACGRVLMEIVGEPETMGLCHHPDRRRHNSGYGVAICEFKEERISVCGETMRWRYGDGGASIGCLYCGARMLTSEFGARMAQVYASALDDQTLFEPQFEQWVSYRATWLVALAVRQFENARP